MDGVRLSDALRCRADDPRHSNNTSEFQQAAYLGNMRSLQALVGLVPVSKIEPGLSLERDR